VRRVEVQLTESAARDLDALAVAERRRLITDIRALATEPLGSPPRFKKLRGFGSPLYRLRSGSYRVVYRLDAEVVTVLRVIDRKDLERVIRRLHPRSR
jgi:mRNA interferase RelE/StbE